MKKKNKIFIITECPYVGIFQAILVLSPELKNLGFELNFIFPEKSRNRYGEQQIEHEQILIKYGKIIHLPLRRKLHYILSDVFYLGRFFKNNKPDIVISFTEYSGKICRFLYNRKLIKNYYHAPQCIGIKRKKRFHQLIEFLFEKLLYKNTDYYLACGPSECYLLNKKYKVPPEKIILCPNFKVIEVASFEKKKKYEFIYVGRMVRDKGVYQLLDIFKILNMLDKIIMIGDGRELTKLRKKYPTVNFLGRISPEEVMSYLLVSKFFVSNSVIEGLPFSLIEAMQAGVIPIVSNVEGHMDLIFNNNNGFLYNNQLEFINCIFKVQLLDDKEQDRISFLAKNTITNLTRIAKESIKTNFQKYE